jgi:hypothetical protein
MKTFVKAERIDITRPVLILFGMNALDALLTIFWVQTGIATESNQLMDALLTIGPLPFLLFKLGFGVFTATVLLYGSHYPLAKFGVRAGLTVYSVVMGIHLFTGLAASGFFF